PLSRRYERASMIRELSTGFVATQGPRAPRTETDIVIADLELESVPDVTLASLEGTPTIR
ncbi:MAG: hypothetical protein KDB80_12610, partial [Planctomycetes bacterium]|nr:hypothetical protein [Planctomycetota bacterium]